MRKSYIQLVLIIICLLSTYFVYERFFKNDSFVQEETEIELNNDSGSIT